MKQFFYLAFLVIIFSSCSPSATNTIPPTTLDHSKSGKSTSTIMASTTDTNTYYYHLSCTCPFELMVEGWDTASIRYDTSGIAESARSHTLLAFPAPGLAPGKYYGSLAIKTVPPDTKENFRDTLRDTVIIK